MADNRKSLAPIPEEEEEDDDTNEDIVERNKNPEDSDWLQKAEDTSVKQVKYELKDVDENICSGPNRPLSSNSHSNGWREVEKPKGHSRLDYSRWDSVDDGSSDDDDDSDEETQPRYKFRFRTAGGLCIVLMGCFILDPPSVIVAWTAPVLLRKLLGEVSFTHHFTAHLGKEFLKRNIGGDYFSWFDDLEAGLDGYCEMMDRKASYMD
ncbi:hypothetical protein KSS87_019236 [Heliosperma pusillum]|nr:hypothetical protein KSS87_019236 [Heliosperma pusillum]